MDSEMTMDPRRAETRLARFTLALLVLYVPLETWVSWPYGLLHPMYLVDVIAMLLMFFGARRSLRARPGSSPGLLAAAWAWTAANGWRATSWRWLESVQGGALDHGRPELWLTAFGTLVALSCFAVTLWLVTRETR